MMQIKLFGNKKKIVNPPKSGKGNCCSYILNSCLDGRQCTIKINSMNAKKLKDKLINRILHLTPIMVMCKNVQYIYLVLYHF